MDLSITAKPRTVLGRQNSKLRKTGFLPAVLYGRGKENQNLAIGAKEFQKVFRQAGENTLVNLVIDGEQRKVLIHDVAKHFMKDEPIHVDFYEVDLTRKIHAKIPVHLVGMAPAVKELAGILIRNLNEIEVEALPADLPPTIEVNIEKLKNFDDAVRVSEVAVAGGVKILNDPNMVIVTVQAPRTEEELAELEKPTTAEAEKAAVEAVAAEPAQAPAEKAEGEAPKEEAKAPEQKTEK